MSRQRRAGTRPNGQPARRKLPARAPEVVPVDEPLTPRQAALWLDVTRRSSDVGERVALLLTYSRIHGASSADVRRVRAELVKGVARECGDARQRLMRG